MIKQKKDKGDYLNLCLFAYRLDISLPHTTND